MPKIKITGKNPLFGEIKINGSKNAALPILAATLLSDESCHIENVPPITDIFNMQNLLLETGKHSNFQKENFLTEASGELSPFASYLFTNRLRASFLVAGPLLAKTGSARVSYPGGCPIGARPVDLHLKGFQKLGASIHTENGYISLKSDKLRGNKIYLDFPSVGATENLMMAATLAKGTTVIENAAAEPEITDLAGFLNKMGAEVAGAGSDTVTVRGVEKLSGCSYSVIPDRIEAGTYLIAAAATAGKVTVTDVMPEHLNPVIAKLRETGTHITVKGSSVTAEGKSTYKAVDIKTMPHPGFPTDLQAQFCAYLSGAKGTSVITETIFENRFMHIGELKRLGAKIVTEGRTAVIEGTTKLNGAQVIAGDLRGSAALVIAGLMAEGTTLLEDGGHLFRGYHHMIENLRSLGAKIELLEP